MARRRGSRKKQEEAIGFLVIVILGIGLLGTIFRYLQHHPAGALDFLFLILVGVGLYLFQRTRTRKRIKVSTLKKVFLATQDNIQTLSRRKLQLVKTDPYGRIIYDAWIGELDYFITHHVEPTCSVEEKPFLHAMQKPLIQTIDKMVDDENHKNPAFLKFSDDMTPAQFEIFCAEALKRTGWDARVTMQSRDQGVDIVAEKDGRRLVLQCKLYASPVGNKAVQEVAAGRAHEKADYGAVVSNNRYTASAEQLAQTNGVMSLHYRDLDSIDTLLGEKAPPAKGPAGETPQPDGH